MNMRETRKLYAALAITDSELDKIERIAREIYRLQTTLHEALLDEVSALESEKPLTRSERKRLARALVNDLDMTGADLDIGIPPPAYV